MNLGKPTGITEEYSGAGSGTVSVTSASYGNNGNDLLDRLSAVTRGAGSTSPTVAAPAQTVYVYNDQPGALEVDACEDLNSLGESTGCAGGVKTARLFDGLGRAMEARTYEGSGYISVKTVYDGLGRVYQESNPYRPATDAVQYTTTGYDAAGRVTQTTTADGSTTARNYSGNRVEVKVAAINGAGFNTRWLYTDGLGRMNKVVEDPGGLGYETDYGYTALDQLAQVTQGAETRSFVYDSLKRLTQAANVETGTAGYGYDANGNLTSKTDARGYTTTIAYDALNRMTGKSYSLNAGTPNVMYNWDTVQPGRLSSVATFHGYGELRELRCAGAGFVEYAIRDWL